MATANHTCVHCGAQYFKKDHRRIYCSLGCFHQARSEAKKSRESIRARHNQHVQVTPGCWLWTGFKTSSGYGRLGCGLKTLLAHRLAYELYVGEIPSGLGVLHRCDNPPCVNPDHLFVGDASDNNKDKMQKGRAPRGETHPASKFTESQVRAMLADKRPYNDIVAEYGISKPHLCGLKGGKFWRHLQDVAE